jgi:hypothetical protein
MTYYEKLNIRAFIGRNVRIELYDGRIIEGILDIDCINEDWEEDGEREGIALEPLKSSGYLEGVYLDEIASIEIMEVAAHVARTANANVV